MPRAMRKIREYSGTETSRAGKPKMCSETSAPAPSAATADSVVAMSRKIGATTARRMSMSRNRMTTRMIGTINSVSRAVASRVSSVCADWPPTIAESSAAWVAARRSSISRKLSAVAGSESVTTVKRVSVPSVDSVGGPWICAPSTDSMASVTSSADSAGAMTDSGDAAPAEVNSAMVSRPSAASDSVRNCSVVDRPMFAPNRPVPRTASSTTMPAR